MESEIDIKKLREALAAGDQAARIGRDVALAALAAYLDTSPGYLQSLLATYADE